MAIRFPRTRGAFVALAVLAVTLGASMLAGSGSQGAAADSRAVHALHEDTLATADGAVGVQLPVAVRQPRPHVLPTFVLGALGAALSLVALARSVERSGRRTHRLDDVGDRWRALLRGAPPMPA